MALSYAQLTEGLADFETRRAAAAAELIQLLETLKFKATSWQTTSIPFALVMLGAHGFAKFQELVAFVATQPYLGTAVGDLLTRLASSHYQRPRGESVTTQIRETFTTATGEGPHTVNIGDVVVSDGVRTFRNVAGLGVVYPKDLTSAAPVILLMEAEVPGTGANVADDTVTTLVTTFAGVTCTNAEDPLTGTSIERLGVDAEADDTLTESCETQWGNLTIQTVRAGTINVCLNAAPGIKKVKIDDNNPRGAGTLDAYVAGDAAVAGGSDVTAAQTALDGRFFGNSGSPPRCQALAASGLTWTPTGTVYYDSNYSSADVQAAVEAALLAFLKATPLGGWDYTPGPANVVREDDAEEIIKAAVIGAAKPVKTVDLTMGDLAVGSFQLVVPPVAYSLVYVAVTAA